MNLHGKDIKIFTANANPKVAAEIAACLGLPLGKSEVKTFSDGEIGVSIQESVPWFGRVCGTVHLHTGQR